MGVLGDEFPDRTLVDLPGAPRRPPTWVAEWQAERPGATPHTVLLSPLSAPDRPHLWFVVVHHPDGGTVDLVAFSTGDRPDGAVLGVEEFRGLGIAWANQVGAVRWDTSDGVAGQLYVAPAHRRSGIATAVVTVASIICIELGLPDLTTDGRLTDLGEAWLRRVPPWWESRAAPRTAVLPPMTPAEDAVGQPRRHLLPD